MNTELEYRLLRVLEEQPRISQRELSRALGVSLGKTNYCLRALIERGWVKANNFRNSENKAAYLYLLTPKGADEKGRATIRFLRARLAEHAALQQEILRLREEIATHHQRDTSNVGKPGEGEVDG